MQQRDLAGNMTGRSSSFTKGNTQPISYHQGIYYIGIIHLIIFMHITQAFLPINNMSLPQGNSQRAVWLYND
jgi:hypothetical protein